MPETSEYLCPISGKPCEMAKSCLMHEISDKGTRSLNLCIRCAKPWFNDQIIGQDINMFDVMTGMMSQQEKTEISPCPSCGASLDIISKQGHLGCTDCYSHFGPERVMPLLGKKIKNIEQKLNAKTLEELENQIKFHISESLAIEDFKEASVLKEKSEKLNIIKSEKNNLTKKMSEAVSDGKFEEAREINKQIQTMIKQFLNDI